MLRPVRRGQVGPRVLRASRRIGTARQIPCTRWPKTRTGKNVLETREGDRPGFSLNRGTCKARLQVDSARWLIFSRSLGSSTRSRNRRVESRATRVFSSALLLCPASRPASICGVRRKVKAKSRSIRKNSINASCPRALSWSNDSESDIVLAPWQLNGLCEFLQCLQVLLEGDPPDFASLLNPQIANGVRDLRQIGPKQVAGRHGAAILAFRRLHGRPQDLARVEGT